MDHPDKAANTAHAVKGDARAILSQGGDMGKDDLHIVVGLKVAIGHEGGVMAATVLTFKDAHTKVEAMGDVGAQCSHTTHCRY